MLDYPNLIIEAVEYLWFMNMCTLIVSGIIAIVSLIFYLKGGGKYDGALFGFAFLCSIYMLSIHSINNYCLFIWPQAVVTRYILGG